MHRLSHQRVSISLNWLTKPVTPCRTAVAYCHILVKVDELQTDALAEQKINDLYEQPRGADFASFTSTYSDDPGSAGRGDLTGLVKAI